MESLTLKMLVDQAVGMPFLLQLPQRGKLSGLFFGTQHNAGIHLAHTEEPAVIQRLIGIAEDH
ncbi:hypothetical protein D3C71_2044110 [compost metagenome]